MRIKRYSEIKKLINIGDYIMSDIDIRDGFRKNGEILVKNNKLYKILKDQHEHFHDLIQIEVEDNCTLYIKLDEHITIIPKKEAKKYLDAEKYNL